MGDTTVITHLFVLGIISLIVNVILLLLIASPSCVVGYSYYAISVRPIFLVALIFSVVLILFYVAYAVMTAIGIILGFLYKDRMRKIGAIILIIINLISIPFFLLNCIFFIAAFIFATARISDPLIILPASLSVILCVFQLCLFVYNFCHIIVICMSFRNRIGNRQAEEYQENELVAAN